MQVMAELYLQTENTIGMAWHFVICHFAVVQMVGK
jgi:hypothetical protein